MKKRAAAIFLTLILALSLLPGTVQAASLPSAQSSNINAQEYDNGRRWASTVKSYLFENEGGGLTRVEYIDGQVVVEDYSSSFVLQASRTIQPELPIWGGFFAGEDFNYLIYGQDNEEENDRKEVIRIVQYDKDWNRLGSDSLVGANTIHPFEAGSLRCTEYGGWLYIRTCHEMYTTSDGLNHQANVMIAVRQSDMTITDSLTSILNVDYGYVSHSFNQFILVDQEGHIVALDHGDAGDTRSAVLLRYKAEAGQESFQYDQPTFLGGGYYTYIWCDKVDVQTFPEAAIHYNDTGAALGGLAETANGYVAAYNFDGTVSYLGADKRSLYLAFVDKNLSASASVQLTTGIDTSVPQLVSTGLDGGYVLWNERNSDSWWGSSMNDTLYYVSYDADGKTGSVQTATAPLSDCQPILYNGKVVWYVTDDSAPIFYTLDDSGVHKFLVNARDQFADLASGEYYLDAVTWAVNGGITNGTDTTAFSPNTSCTRGQVVTFLWRAMGEPKPSSASSSFTDVSNPQEYYYDAVLWAVEKGITSGTSDTTFSPNDLCTRGQVVTFLWRVMGEQEPLTTSSPFTDVSNPKDYYYDAVLWAKEKEITSGTSDTTFSPHATCVRGQVVTFLYNCLAK